MITFFIKYSTYIPIVLIPILFVAAWLSPPVGMTLLIVFLALGFFINCLVIIKKHREAYLQGKISRIICVRNICLEIIGILFVLVVAGWIGDSLGRTATRQINNNLEKFIAGIFVGLCVGIAVGIFVQRTRKKLLGILQNRTSIQP